MASVPFISVTLICFNWVVAVFISHLLPVSILVKDSNEIIERLTIAISPIDMNLSNLDICKVLRFGDGLSDITIEPLPQNESGMMSPSLAVEPQNPAE